MFANLALIFLGILLLFFGLKIGKYRSKLLFIVVSSTFIIKIVLMLFMHYVSNVYEHDEFVFEDDRKYHLTSAEIAAGWRDGRTIAITDIDYRVIKNAGYYYLNAVVYTLFGTDTINSRIVNVIVSSLTIIVVYSIASMLFDARAGGVAALLYGFLPDVNVWSVLQFKDTFVTFFSLLSAREIIRLHLDNRISWISFPLVLFLLLLFQIRADSTIVLLAAHVVSVCYKSFYANGRSPAAFFMGFGGGALIVILVSILAVSNIDTSGLIGSNLFSDKSGYSNHSFDFRDLLNYTKQDLGGGFLSLGFIFSFSDLWRLPISMTFVMLTPFPPWPIGRSISTEIIAASVVPWFFLVPGVFVSLFLTIKQNRKEIVPLIVIIMAIWLGLAFFLYAFSPQRHRLELVPYLLILLAGYYPAITSKYKQLWKAAILGMILFSIYYAFKR